MPHAPLALTIPLAAVLLLLALPSAIAAYRGRTSGLDRMGRLGLHTPAAQRSDEAFHLANRVAAPLVTGAAAVGLVCAVLVLALPVGVVGAIVIAALGLAGVLGQLYGASTMGERAAMTVPPPARKPWSGSGNSCAASVGGDGRSGAGGDGRSGAGSNGDLSSGASCGGGCDGYGCGAAGGRCGCGAAGGAPRSAPPAENPRLSTPQARANSATPVTSVTNRPS